MLERLRLDDAVGAVPIHAFGGATGALLVAFFARPEYLAGGSRLMQLGAQAAGVLTNFIWSFGVGLILFYLLNKAIGLRVTPEQEEKGLNIVEFPTSIPGLIITRRSTMKAGCISRT